MNYPCVIVALDDDEDDCHILTYLINDMFGKSVSVYCTIRVHEFFAHLDQLNTIPDLIILDYYLFLTTASEIIPILKAHPIVKDVPIIVWSSFATDEQKNDCLAKGATGYMLKESNIDDFKGRLEQMITSRIPQLNYSREN